MWALRPLTGPRTITAMCALLANAVLDGLAGTFDGLAQLSRSRRGVVPDDIADGSLDLEPTPPLSSLFDALGVHARFADVVESNNGVPDCGHDQCELGLLDRQE